MCQVTDSNSAKALLAGGADAELTQLVLARLLDLDGVMVIPKAQRAKHQRENLQALDVKLDDEDRRANASLAKDQSFVQRPFAPDWHAKKPSYQPIKLTRGLVIGQAVQGASNGISSRAGIPASTSSVRIAVNEPDMLSSSNCSVRAPATPTIGYSNCSTRSTARPHKRL